MRAAVLSGTGPAARDAGRARARRDAERDARASGEGVRVARGSRYGDGRAGDELVPDGAERPRRDKIHSVLTALPVIMLVAGLYLYYSGERAQSHGTPIVAESVEADGVFTGLSLVKSGGDGRHYLWFDDGTRVRGVRIRAERRAALGALERGEEIALELAPTVSGSTTLWAWRVERGGVTLIDDSSPSR